MVGITLSPEQIRSAPPEVRRWLEHQLAVSLGLRLPEAEAAPEAARLLALSPDETASMLPLIEHMLPVLSVFFELGRTGESIGRDGVEAFRLTDILQHSRLETMDQVIASLEVINEAARSVRQDANAVACALDKRGYCLVAAETQRNIARIWRQIMEAHAPQEGSGASPKSDARSFGLSAQIPASSIHMGGK